MNELKQYSIINEWCANDQEQGSFAWSGAARSSEEADMLAVEAMQKSYADEYGAEWEGEPGEQLMFIEGADIFQAVKAAENLETLIETAQGTHVSVQSIQDVLKILRPDIPEKI